MSRLCYYIHLREEKVLKEMEGMLMRDEAGFYIDSPPWFFDFLGLTEEDYRWFFHLLREDSPYGKIYIGLGNTAVPSLEYFQEFDQVILLDLPHQEQIHAFCRRFDRAGIKEEVIRSLKDSMTLSDAEIYRAIDHAILREGRESYGSLEEKTVLREQIFDAIRNLGILEKYLRDDRVTEIIVREGAVRGVRTGTEEIACRACIVCTGGLSYPLTGSTGDGYRFAEALGHTVTPPRPSLVPLVCAEDSCERMQGLSLKNVELRVYEDDRLLCREQGEMLFTHFGVSGPLVLSASARMFRSGEPSNPHTLSGSKHADNAKNHRPSVSNGLESSTGHCYRLEIDMKPALDEKTLDQRLLRDFAKYQNRNLSNALVDLLPHTMIPEVIAAAGVPPELPVHSLTREMRQSLLKTVKSFSLTVVGTRPIDEAIVTAGGVRTAEINPRSMQSRKVSGLFFAGEVLDLDAYTGGYNLQIAWSTGRMAGMRAAEYALSE